MRREWLRCSWTKTQWLPFRGKPLILPLNTIYFQYSFLSHEFDLRRPGTSLNASRGNSSDSGSMDQSVRPVSQSGRPLTGFSRPGSSRPMSSTTDVRSALQSGRRTGTARPMTNLGREVRLGTASLQASGNLVDSSRINVKKYAGRTGIAMAITDYLIYVEHNIRKALELCSEATKAVRVLPLFKLLHSV